MCIACVELDKTQTAHTSYEQERYLEFELIDEYGKLGK